MDEYQTLMAARQALYEARRAMILAGATTDQIVRIEEINEELGEALDALLEKETKK
jgi:hypothetical protein